MRLNAAPDVTVPGLSAKGGDQSSVLEDLRRTRKGGERGRGPADPVACSRKASSPSGSSPACGVLLSAER